MAPLPPPAPPDGRPRTTDRRAVLDAILYLVRTGRERAFRVAGPTWIVERSFAWLGRDRRLANDHEYEVRTSETMIDLAAIRLVLNRLAPA